VALLFLVEPRVAAALLDPRFARAEKELTRAASTRARTRAAETERPPAHVPRPGGSERDPPRECTSP
jgi:hypothetical protein